jgi:hypothetical protein
MVAGSGGRALAEKRAAEEGRSLTNYIERLIEWDAEKKSRRFRTVAGFAVCAQAFFPKASPAGFLFRDSRVPCVPQNTRLVALHSTS